MKSRPMHAAVAMLLLASVLAACAPAAAAPTAVDDGPSPSPGLAPTSTPEPPTPTPVEPSPTVTASPTTIPMPQAITAADPSTFRVIRHSWLEDAPDEVFTAQVSPDGTMLVLGGCDLTDEGYCFESTALRLISVDTGALLRELGFVSPVIELLAFSPDSTMLAVAGCNMPLYLVGEPFTNCRQPRLWIVDLASGEVRHDLDAFESNITSLVFSPDGSRLYAGVVYTTAEDKTDNEIRIYDTASGERIGWLETAVNNHTRMTLGITPDGRFLIMGGSAFGSWPSMVKWWDVSDPGQPLEVHQEVYVDRFLLSPQGSTVLVQNPTNDSLMLFDVASGERQAFFPRIDADDLLQFLDEERLLVRDRPNLAVFDLSAGAVTQAIAPGSYNYHGDYTLSPDRRTLVTFGYSDSDGSLGLGASLWDTETWLETPITVYFMHSLFDLWRNASRFSADQTRFVGVGLDGFEITVLGPASPEQAVARQAMLDYLEALARGGYAQAAEMLRVRDIEGLSEADAPPLPDLPALVPEVAGEDWAAVLEVLCATPEFRCMPVREVAYESQISPTSYLFLVSFAGPDGEVAVWPPCAEDPATCQRPDGLFEYFVELEEDGIYRVVNGFPPGLEIRAEAFYP